MRSQLIRRLQDAWAKPLHSDELWELRPRGWLWATNRSQYDTARVDLITAFLSAPDPCFLQVDPGDTSAWPSIAGAPVVSPGLYALSVETDRGGLEADVLYLGDYTIYTAPTPVGLDFWNGRNWWKVASDHFCRLLQESGISGCIMSYTDDDEWRVFLGKDLCGVAG